MCASSLPRTSISAACCTSAHGMQHTGMAQSSAQPASLSGRPPALCRPYFSRIPCRAVATSAAAHTITFASSPIVKVPSRKLAPGMPYLSRIPCGAAATSIAAQQVGTNKDQDEIRAAFCRLHPTKLLIKNITLLRPAVCAVKSPRPARADHMCLHASCEILQLQSAVTARPPEAIRRAQAS